MIYFAHRGASAYRVQNTVESFAYARALGATRYELDVHLLADGQLAVHHDYTLASTAGVDKNLAELKAADLSHYPLKNPFTQETVYVPLLQDILPVITPQLEVLNIEIKNEENRYPAIEKVLCQTVRQYPQLADKMLFSSFDLPTLQRLRACAPWARIGVLTRNFQLEQALALRAESVHINQTRLTADIAAQCHQNGLKVFVYTVNDSAAAERAAQLGADGIFTDKIDLFC